MADDMLLSVTVVAPDWIDPVAPPAVAFRPKAEATTPNPRGGGLRRAPPTSDDMAELRDGKSEVGPRTLPVSVVVTEVVSSSS